MGRSKALLPLGGATFLERLLGLYRALGVESIVVVLGDNASDVRAAVPLAGARVVINERPEEGMLSSIHLALDSLPPTADGLVVHPVDYPAVAAATVDGLRKLFHSRPDCIIIPRYSSRRGHPVIFPRRLFSELKAAPLAAGARHVVRANEEHIAYLEVDDSEIFANINTPADYEALVKRWKKGS